MLIVAFNPNQVKSADYNSGEFSPLHNEIANYEIDNDNINDLLSDEEKKDILREIKKINKAKRSLIDTGGDFLYVVDHTDKEGLEHLERGQEGFLCKEIIDIRGFSKEQIDNIKNYYGNIKGSNEATRGLERWLEGNGYSERLSNSDSINAKDRKSASNNVRLDSKTQEREARRGQSSEDSSENFPGSQIKTGYDGTNHPRYMDAKEFLQSLSEDEVKKQLSLMKQEENDYDTLFAVESPKKTERTGPQDFTFADGTTLRVPFKPNEQQVAALNAMDGLSRIMTSM